jgi:hypothetical protein
LRPAGEQGITCIAAALLNEPRGLRAGVLHTTLLLGGLVAEDKRNCKEANSSECQVKPQVSWRAYPSSGDQPRFDFVMKVKRGS